MFECNICHKTFNGYRQLNGHKSIHKEKRYSVSRRKKPLNHCLQCKNETNNQKFCSEACHYEYIWENTKLLIESGEILSEHRMRQYVLKTREHVCSECGISEEWNGKKLTLQIDHIDGNSDNSKLDNLRFLCPNCHTQTETWCHRNTKNSKRNMYARQWRNKFRS